MILLFSILTVDLDICLLVELDLRIDTICLSLTLGNIVELCRKNSIEFASPTSLLSLYS